MQMIIKFVLIALLSMPLIGSASQVISATLMIQNDVDIQSSKLTYEIHKNKNMPDYVDIYVMNAQDVVDESYPIWDRIYSRLRAIGCSFEEDFLLIASCKK